MDPITNLTISISKPGLSTEAKLKKICQCALQAISKANRISLWKFNTDKTEISCLICFESNNNSFTSGAVLSQKDFPNYFEQILSGEVLMASDARNHDATACFNEAYFEPNDIHSLLDFVYQKDFEPTGVICCESAGKQVEWETTDVKSLRRISNMTSLFFDN